MAPARLPAGGPPPPGQHTLSGLVQQSMVLLAGGRGLCLPSHGPSSGSGGGHGRRGSNAQAQKGALSLLQTPTHTHVTLGRGGGGEVPPPAAEGSHGHRGTAPPHGTSPTRDMEWGSTVGGCGGGTPPGLAPLRDCSVLRQEQTNSPPPDPQQSKIASASPPHPKALPSP